jgi:uncharacterized protein
MMEEPKIPGEMYSALQSVIPSVLASADKNGNPNVTYISQVYYVDERHVALSFQFMNKTWKNIQENPRITVCITCPNTLSIWKLGLLFLEQKTEGDVFEEMDMQITALSSRSEREKNFKIQSALICRIESIEKQYSGY